MKKRKRIVPRDEALWLATYQVYEVYGLVDPRDGQIHYVGRTNAGIEKRLAGHLSAPGDRSEKYAWFLELARKRLFPSAILLARVVGAIDGIGAEKYWTAEGRRLGWPLKHKFSPSTGSLGVGCDEDGAEWTVFRLGLDLRDWRP